MPLRILIADDHGLLRAGLRSLLGTERNMEVVGVASDGFEALRLAKELQPDIVLMDVSMPGLGGIETTRRLVKFKPDARVLILTVHEDQGLLQEAIRAGAAGYILKRAVESELINAIQAVARGDLYVYPTMTRALLEGKVTRPSGRTEIGTLTSREIEVLRLIVRGYTNRQMGEKLNLSVRTVESHRANLMEKLQLRSRVDLVRFAAENGLLETR
jgi:two-component system response regulator NreC